MIKHVVMGLIAALAGAVCTQQVLRAVGTDDPVATPSEAEEQILVSGPRSESFSSSILATELDMLSAVAAIADPGVLQARINELTELPGSPERNNEIQALLFRYLELSPERAIQYARAANLERSFLVLMYQAWAEVSPGAVFQSLSDLSDPDFVREIALGLARQFGADSSAIEELASLLPPLDRNGFVSKALVQLAGVEPQRAFENALELTSHDIRGQTMFEIAREWARQDPASALGSLRQFSADSPRLRNTFHVAVVDEWASWDPDRALEYLISAEGQELFALKSSSVDAIVDQLAIRRPEKLLQLADGLPANLRFALRQAALEPLVNQDLDAAIDLAATMPPGLDRSQMLKIIAESYAEADPVRALEWASRDPSMPPDVLRNVLAEVAAHDLPLAIEVALSSPYHARSISGWLSSSGYGSSFNSSQMREVADLLVTAGEPQPASMTQLMRTWSQRDPDAATQWLLDRTSAISSTQSRQLARGIADSQLDYSLQIIDALPPGRRGDWIIEVASTYMQESPDAALNWLAQYRSEPAYDEWVSAAAQRSLSVPMGFNLSRSAEMLATARQPDQSVVSELSRRWAQSDPGEAAQWALSLGDPQAQSAAAAAATSSWMELDNEAAERWVLSLPGGELRDAALAAVVTQSMRLGNPVDRRIISAFSTERSRDLAISATPDN